MSDAVLLETEHCARLADLHGANFDSGWSVTEFQSHIENGFDDVLGTFVDGLLVGFIVTRTQADQSEILTIIIRADHRGQGLGKKLLTAAEQMVRARGADIIFLEVAADNPLAEAFYIKAKYQRCGTRKAYYRREMGRVDAHLYQKRL